MLPSITPSTMTHVGKTTITNASNLNHRSLSPSLFSAGLRVSLSHNKNNCHGNNGKAVSAFASRPSFLTNTSSSQLNFYSSSSSSSPSSKSPTYSNSIKNHYSNINKKNYFTIYGRQAVLDTLQNLQVSFHHVHITKEFKNQDKLNKKGGFLYNIVTECNRRNIPIKYTDPKKIAHISKNGSLAQGVVADIKTNNITNETDFLKEHSNYVLVAMDGITTQRNAGMIFRSCAASGCSGVIVPKERTVQPNDPLVVRSSCGAVFRTHILRCQTSLAQCLKQFIDDGASIRLLQTEGSTTSLYELNSNAQEKVVYVLGSESEGISTQVKNLSGVQSVRIPMHCGVESLNVGVAAALVCYHHFQTPIKSNL